MTLSQWDSLLKHLGVWQGSFTRLSPQGNITEDVPSKVTLAGLNQNQTIRQTIQYFSPDTQRVTQERVLEYSSLSRSTLFHENGAFSQGAIQFGPYSEFGAEFGFVEGDRRLRLVQLFDTSSQLASLTLIRERLPDGATPERPPLTVDRLLGDWQGQAISLYPDFRTPDTYATTLSIRREGDRLQQHLTLPGRELSSTAHIEDNRLLFDQGIYPVQVLLLPDGASSNTPLTIPRGKPFVLEAGWLVQDGLRQRLVRRYDAQGGWSSLTLVTEQKLSPL